MNLKNTLSQKETFNESIDWLFSFTQDFIERKKWDKQTLEIGFFDGCTELKKEAKVFTKSREGVYMETEYLTFKAPYEISIKMLNKSPIFKDFVGTWNYDSIDNNNTTLRITYCFNLRFPYSLAKRKMEQRIKVNIAEKLNFLKNHLNELKDEKRIIKSKTNTIT